MPGAILTRPLALSFNSSSYAGSVRNSTNSLAAQRHRLEQRAREVGAALLLEPLVVADLVADPLELGGSSSRTSSGVIGRPSSSVAPWRIHCHTCPREISAVAASSIRP